ncbi:MAG: LysR family transcriptional regulator [Comamonas sp.]
MDHPAFTLLVYIIDPGTLRRAASTLKMSRANVSYHLTQLEKATGVQLVRRTTRRVEPTEVGLRLYEHGRAIRNELAAAGETIRSLGKGLQGRVGLAVPSGYGQLVMTDWLIAFKRQYPDIVLDLIFENRVDNLVRDEVDIAVRVLPTPPDSLVARHMGEMNYVACASIDYARQNMLPQQPEDLRHVPLITSGVVGKQLLVRAYQGDVRKEIRLEPTLISEHFPFLRQGIMAGLGVGIVPDYVIRAEVERGEVVTTLRDWRLSIFGNNMYLLWMPNRHQTKAVRTMIDFLLERAEAERTG